MGSYFRLWLLLLIAFAGVFGVFVNHDLVMVGYHGPGSWQVKSEAPLSEVIAASLLAGAVISTCVTVIYWGAEWLIRAASRRRGSAA